MKMRSVQKKPRVPFGKSIQNNIFILKMAFKMDKVMVIMRLVMGFFTGLNHGVGIFFTTQNLNMLDIAVSSENKEQYLTNILILTAMMGVYTLLYELFFAWYYKLLNPKHKLNFIRLIHKSFFVKASDIDLSCYDTPEFYNDFIYSMQNCDKSIVNTIDQLGDLIRALVASFSIVTVIMTVDYKIALIILGVSIVNMIVRIIGNGFSYQYDLEMNELWRKTWYIEKFFSLSNYAKEIRLTDVSENLINEYDETTRTQLKENLKYNAKSSIIRAISLILSQGLTIFIILYMTYGLFQSDSGVLIGGFSAAVTAGWKLKYLIYDLQNKFVSMNKDSLFADKVRGFLETEAKIKSGNIMLKNFESLEFKNVSFKYDKECVLSNVSFKLSKGERIAFVGYNGAGKTTTTKLIMRLYDVTEGEILINGINIKEYDLSSLREKIGAVFQDYKVFSATVAENVLGDIYTEDKKDIVLNALKDSTFDDKLKSLPQGIHTELTREFYSTGTDLSGGENQKIAIARAFAHDNELLIMDEPSSALDPIAEYNLNLGVNKNARDKAVIFITHRLSTTRHVDKIYMIEKGRIIERGSHEELMLQGGKYAHMFNLQAEKYKA